MKKSEDSFTGISAITGLLLFPLLVISHCTQIDNLNYKFSSPASGSTTAPGFTISTISGNTTEAGGNAFFTVKLNTKPAGAVTLALTSSNTAEGTIGVANLVFTTANWDTQQIVNVTGVDDGYDDGDITYTITTGPVTGGDAEYNALDPADVSVVNTDNDTAGITVSSISSNITTEAAAAGSTFTIVLDSRPTSNVTLTLSSSDTAEGQLQQTGGVCNNSGTYAVTSCNVVFTSANWNSAQQLRVKGQDDAVIDGNKSYTVVIGSSVSSDSLYSGIDKPDFSMTNNDNDTASITVTPSSGLLTSETGTTATFTVVLTSQPSQNVTITLNSNTPAEGRLKMADGSGTGSCNNTGATFDANCTLVFTSTNWNTGQVVGVVGQDDANPDGIQSYSIITSAASSADTNYNNVDPANVSLSNSDNENYKRIFVTETPYDGTLASSGVVGADNKCNGDNNKPNASTYKAMISVGASRRATVTSGVGDSQVDWVLVSGTNYYRAADGAFIATPGANNLFSFPTTNNMVGGSQLPWMPFLSGWRNYDTAASPYTSCDGFTTNSSARWGGYSCDISGTGSNQALGCDIQCNNSRRLLCVEQ